MTKTGIYNNLLIEVDFLKTSIKLGTLTDDTAMIQFNMLLNIAKRLLGNGTYTFNLIDRFFTD